MTKKIHTIVFMCRVQPVHNAHAQIILRATELAEQVIIVVGSAGRPRTFENPWSGHERRMMLQNVVDTLPIDPTVSVRIEENVDTVYNDPAWVERIQKIVSKHTRPGNIISIIGHPKDLKTSGYLKMFPQWGSISVDLVEPLNATDIRSLYFNDRANMNFFKNVVPRPVYDMMNGWMGSPDYLQIIRERQFILDHNKQYEGLKYPPIFVTSDAVVIQSGHVLMGRRKAEPGRGLLAFPGGYMNAKTDASVVASMIRELREETKIKVPAPVLLGSITDVKVFDAIDRSPRGRIITHAHKIVLADGPLVHVKGSDDFRAAGFIPFSEVKSDECFEDHYDIFQWAMNSSK